MPPASSAAPSSLRHSSSVSGNGTALIIHWSGNTTTGYERGTGEWDDLREYVWHQ
jgi:hypothetical protein